MLVSIHQCTNQTSVSSSFVQCPLHPYVCSFLFLWCIGELDEVDHTLLSRYGVPKSQPCSLPPGVDESNYVGFRPLSLTYAAKLHKAFTGSSELRRNDWITK